MRGSNRWRRGCQVLLLASAGIGLNPATALATTYEGPRLGAQPENSPSVGAAVFERGASQSLIPGQETTCDAQCERLVQALEDEPGDVPLVVALLRESNRLAERVKVWPKWSALGSFTPVAAGATFGVGWEIGTGIRKKWIEDEVSTTPTRSPQFNPVDEGTMLFGGPEGYIYAPSDGYHVWQYAPFQRRHLDGEYCNGMDYQPTGTQMFSTTGSALTWCPAYVESPASAHVFFRPAPVFKPKSAPTRPSVGGVDTWQDQPLTEDEVEIRTREQLLGDDFPLFNALADYATNPELRYDPRITEERDDHRCDRGAPVYQNANGNDDPYALTSAEPFTVGQAPPTSPSTTQVSMKRGIAYWAPGRFHEQYDWGAGTSASKPEPVIDDWRGWGLRHIVTKHGWSPADEAETRLALSTATPSAGEETNSKYVIPTPERGVGNILCERTVVIDVSGTPSRDVVTSYSSPR